MSTVEAYCSGDVVSEYHITDSSRLWLTPRFGSVVVKSTLLIAVSLVLPSIQIDTRRFLPINRVIAILVQLEVRDSCTQWKIKPSLAFTHQVNSTNCTRLAACRIVSAEAIIAINSFSEIGASTGWPSAFQALHVQYIRIDIDKWHEYQTRCLKVCRFVEHDKSRCLQ